MYEKYYENYMDVINLKTILMSENSQKVLTFKIYLIQKKY